ncbi:MAG: carbohydrate porin [Bacteroidota bacterium]|nr:carbohydrate porin [Bacteroidota bacterium]
MKHILGFFTILLLPLLLSFAQSDSSVSSECIWNLHFQQTIVTQYHPDFSASYTGANSLKPSEPAQTSLTSTFFFGRRLWNGADVYFNAELAGGSGLSGATGIAGFSNGETFRIGDPSLRIALARGYLKQVIALSDDRVEITDGPNQFAGVLPASRISIAVGKFSIADYFDKNKFTNDPRSQFLNWALMNSGAWDYPADTRGYTWGIVLEYIQPKWAFRVSSTLVPTEANKSEMDLNIHAARSETAELEYAYQLADRKGIFRVLGSYTQAHMGNYQQAAADTSDGIDIVKTRAYGRTKYGVALNVEQQLSDFIGAFARASWNDGKNETWMFTEIDRAFAFGVLADGALWQKNEDRFGAAFVLNGISEDHRKYLQAGGYGFIIGDGHLNYSIEMIGEFFYSWSLIQGVVWLTPDYQFVVHPAYNRDRGPVHIFGVRVHTEF